MLFRSGNNMMYLPLDKLMQNMPAAPGGSLTPADFSRLTDQVLNELRTRQGATQTTTTRREGR